MMSAKSRRPRSVTITLLGVILIGIWYAGQLFALLRQSGLLLTLNITPDPRLRMVIAALWMVLFWGAAVALWRRKAFTSWFIPLLLTLAALYELTLLGLFVQNSESGESWLIRIWLYSVMILFAAWALNRGAAKPFFDKGTG